MIFSSIEKRWNHLLFTNSLSLTFSGESTGGNFMRFNGNLRMKSGSIPALGIVSNQIN